MSITQPRNSLRALTTPLFAPLAAAIACSVPEQTGNPATESAVMESAPNPFGVVELIASGQVVFAVFSGTTTHEEGALEGLGEELDLVFHGVDSGPFDPWS